MMMCRLKLSAVQLWQQLITWIFHSVIIHVNVTCVNITVNGERFAGLNFRVFQEHRESFPVNIYLYYTNFIMALFKCCKHKASQKFSLEKVHWVESAKV